MLSPHMGQELADALRGSVGQLGSLIKVIAENTGITEEQAAAVGLLADLPKSLCSNSLYGNSQARKQRDKQ